LDTDEAITFFDDQVVPLVFTERPQYDSPSLHKTTDDHCFA
jgi:hypothetical protein